jgi:hypothetical protein
LENYSISKILSAIKLPVARQAVRHVRQNVPEAIRLLTDEQPNGKRFYRF